MAPTEDHTVLSSTEDWLDFLVDIKNTLRADGLYSVLGAVIDARTIAAAVAGAERDYFWIARDICCCCCFDSKSTGRLGLMTAAAATTVSCEVWAALLDSVCVLA